VLKIVDYLGNVGGQGHLILLLALGITIFFIFIMLVLAFKRAKKNEAKGAVSDTKKDKISSSAPISQVKGDSSSYIEYLKEALPSVKEEVRQIDTILAGLKGGGGSLPIDPNPELEREIEKLKKELAAAQNAAKETTVVSSDPQIEEEMKKISSENEELKKTSSLLQTKYDEAVKGQDDLKTEIEGLKAKLEESSKTSSSGVDQKLVDELNEKISFLESQLAEYEVIEEDIANLKALQEEKQELLAKISALEGGGEKSEAPKADESSSETQAIDDSGDEFEEEKPEPAANTEAQDKSGIANEFEKFLDADSPT
jgi:DNA repair exonuclease SbcCD ATPase subunit